MRYYPVNLDIRNRNCLVVGGGDVGTRKVMTLLDCGAMVVVVSPAVTEKIEELSNKGLMKLERRGFKPTDLDQMFLVIGATDNPELNRQIHTEAERLGMLCNIADRPEVCNFILPAIVNRGDLIIAISTSGKSPAFAKKMRKDLEKKFGTEYAEFLTLMGGIRTKLLSEDHEPEAHKHLFENLIKRDVVNLIKQGDIAAINSLLFEILGEGYLFDELMANPPTSNPVLKDA
ncbi:MAG: bifunctional precorrin-2 dehydrogenase/sirohydrochlorin ferrochelatase [Deltaproteobacteria bacterium]|nr:bifunctional precorrin-2 dehydrogenase/sirohydrochlorin ferrochelatase [Deltaproteobacteria bacterium]MBW2598338.1 bifunctional precorrin-2 dehydrogenase/sirohydrochlorin ferrochelatase [Deltaproteobacteria bacterium]MBW2679397.1 bifunctional precorrin-2 dehydrogenase/sirohydrochlorin ferrochelatase [Deltaproteobacteria bacterium]